MRIKFLLTTFLFLLSLLSFATDVSFIVYHAQGTVTVNGKTMLKKGDKIMANQRVSLADKSSVMLICSNYKVIQLTKKGSFAVQHLLAQCNKDAAGYSSSYFKYVWNEFTHPHGKPETNPGEYMKNVGAVSRGCNLFQTGIAVDSMHFYAGTLSVNVRTSIQNPVIALYEVPIDGAPLRKLTLANNSPIRIGELAKGLTPGEYFWTLQDADGNGCERSYLKLWEPGAYSRKLNELFASVPITTPAETAFAKAFVLQENHFTAEALRYYKIAAKLAPGNKIFKKTLSVFYETNF
ncbi:MAG: hypothetical protein EOO06_12920 [Chitinophagaceae bacterium]|nr:MAG: hypothetical protein EOO06_12920 [Chitinophagaceae bacterium]